MLIYKKNIIFCVLFSSLIFSETPELFEHSQSRSITEGLRSSKNIKINGYQHSIILEDKLIYQQRKFISRKK